MDMAQGKKESSGASPDDYFQALVDALFPGTVPKPNSKVWLRKKKKKGG